jgi:hypothetical protein
LSGDIGAATSTLVGTNVGEAGTNKLRTFRGLHTCFAILGLLYQGDQLSLCFDPSRFRYWFLGAW